jgi:hypothetical protein
VSILNRPSDGLLSVLIALRRGLIAYGPQRQQDLLKLCAPASVVPDGRTVMARNTVTRWKQLGFFQEVDDQLQLSPQIAKVPTEDVNGLRTAVLKLVMRPENNPALTSESGEDHEGSLASDFSRASAWVLAQDPYVFPTNFRGAGALQDEQHVTPRAFTNDTRWSGFVEWAPFLGIGRHTAKLNFVPEPSFAVRGVLPEVFQMATELTQAVFLERLADQLPIVDKGRYRKAIESKTRTPWREFQAGEISPSLTAALLSLEASREIRLESRSDAPQKILTGREAKQLHGFSHVVRVSTAE